MTVFGGDIIYAADINTISDAALDGPIVRLIQQSGQSLADNTATALTFTAGSENIDTHNYHDDVTNNTRITPLRAGYYHAFGRMWIANAITTASIESRIYVNGAVYAINRIKPDVANTIASSIDVEAIVSLDGIDDYVELYGLQDDTAGTARSTTTGAFSSVFELIYERPF